MDRPTEREVETGSPISQTGDRVIYHRAVMLAEDGHTDSPQEEPANKR